MKLLFPFSLFLVVSCPLFLTAQPEPRFDPFDWTAYRHLGRINSITEGYNYVYFGTEDGGIVRYHIFRNAFAPPITRAQGLSGNRIQLVHFDRETGTLWVVTDKGLEYSYSREGDWYYLSFEDIGIAPGTRILRMGSSARNLWLLAGSMFIKLDHLSGIVLGMAPKPDEDSIAWSSGPLLPGEKPPEKIADYSVMDGWMLNLNQFIDPFGRVTDITTIYQGQEYWVGAEDGTIFLGDKQLEAFYPQRFGLANTDVTTFTHGRQFWVAGRYGVEATGVTRFDYRRKMFDFFDFDVNINMNPQSLFSSLEVGDEIWLGGKSGILVYDKKESFWRILDETRGLPVGSIVTMASDDSAYVWVGLSAGIARMNIKTKRAEPIGIEDLFLGRFIFDLEIIGDQLWIGNERGLYIYDTQRKTLVKYTAFGDFSLLRGRQKVFSYFWKIRSYKQQVFIATPQGILRYDSKSKQWDVIIEPSEYQGKRVLAMEFSGNQCFLGTLDGVIRIDLRQHFSRVYNYSFIRRVNDMYITNGTLWLGTPEGLISFLWKKDQ